MQVLTQQTNTHNTDMTASLKVLDLQVRTFIRNSVSSLPNLPAGPPGRRQVVGHPYADERYP